MLKRRLVDLARKIGRGLVARKATRSRVLGSGASPSRSILAGGMAPHLAKHFISADLCSGAYASGKHGDQTPPKIFDADSADKHIKNYISGLV